MIDRAIVSRVVIGLFVAIAAALSDPLPATAEPACRTGASALGNAYVRANPLYALYYGSLESYVASNSRHFVAGADAVRCAGALSQALMAGTIQAHDPARLPRQRDIDARLETGGPGTAQHSSTTRVHMMSRHFARLARVLPPAALGNYGPLRTPVTELEQMQMFAGEILQSMMDPAAFESNRPQIEALAALEYTIITDLALALAAQ